jgi:hypothetical protein
VGWRNAFTVLIRALGELLVQFCGTFWLRLALAACWSAGVLEAVVSLGRLQAFLTQPRHPWVVGALADNGEPDKATTTGADNDVSAADDHRPAADNHVSASSLAPDSATSLQGLECAPGAAAEVEGVWAAWGWRPHATHCTASRSDDDKLQCWETGAQVGQICIRDAACAVDSSESDGRHGESTNAATDSGPQQHVPRRLEYSNHPMRGVEKLSGSCLRGVSFSIRARCLAVVTGQVSFCGGGGGGGHTRA